MFRFKIIMIMLTFILFLTPVKSLLHAQILDDLDETSLYNESLVEIRYEKKSAGRAMLMSAVFPGAGQFYVSNRNITAYIFPVIEIGLWYAFYRYDKKGDDVTRDFQKFADTYYDRKKQDRVQEHLSSQYANDMYNEKHFRLDAGNTQHYYEDIGKYDRYIFGWDDWYDKYVLDSGQNNLTVYWMFIGDDTGNPNDIRWVGNKPIDSPDMQGYDTPYSERRAEYIRMRHTAEDNYSKKRTMNFLILLNHAVSVFDANRVTRNYNREYMKTTSFTPQIKTAVINNELTPMLGFNLQF